MSESTHRERYNPMNQQSKGTKLPKYEAYRSSEHDYEVVNYTKSPKVSHTSTFSWQMNAEDYVKGTPQVNTVEKDTILQRFVGTILTAGKKLKESIRNFFKRSK